jgi:hypothetical protein
MFAGSTSPLLSRRRRNWKEEKLPDIRFICFQPPPLTDEIKKIGATVPWIHNP